MWALPLGAREGMRDFWRADKVRPCGPGVDFVWVVAPDSTPARKDRVPGAPGRLHSLSPTQAKRRLVWATRRRFLSQG